MKMWTDRRMDRKTDKRTEKRTNKQTELHQFQKVLVMMVIYVPVKYEFHWTNRYRVRVQKQNVDKQTDGQTNGQKTDKRTHRISPISNGT